VREEVPNQKSTIINHKYIFHASAKRKGLGLADVEEEWLESEFMDREPF
jgi:hypothetical protein